MERAAKRWTGEFSESLEAALDGKLAQLKRLRDDKDRELAMTAECIALLATWAYRVDEQPKSDLDAVHEQIRRMRAIVFTIAGAKP